MAFTLEALQAKHGDALLLHWGDERLIVIDGGPSGVFDETLGPRLEAIRTERGRGTLPIRLPRLSRGRAIGYSVLLGLGMIPVIVDGATPGTGTFWTFIGTYIAVWAMLELSIVVVTGYAGLISLMPFTFVGIGTFTTGLVVAVWGWPFWLAVPIAALAVDSRQDSPEIADLVPAS